MKPVVIIGMGLSPGNLTKEHLEKISQADILVGGKRHLDCFEDVDTKKKVITKNITEIIEYIKEQMELRSIVVLASGDPLFYGIGAVLVKSLGPDNILFYPNITSVSGAFSRIKEPWHDAHVVSLHGREHETALQDALETRDKIVVFTDSVKNPAWIANSILEKKISGFEMCVLEQLGSPTEQVNWYSLAEAADKIFQEPNILILKRTSPATQPEKRAQLGAPDDWYEHQNGLITKAEVRAITLSKLRLLPHHILWDLGAGSGSISIEAALFVREGRIFAVEKNKERIRQVETNKKRFGIRNLTIIDAVLPQRLKDLPKPDRIFIGGGGKDLKEIIANASERLDPTGIMVINTVLLQNCEIGRETLAKLGYKTDTIQIQVNRSRKMPWGERFEAQNPVWIISGKKVHP
jgi:precorrin-6Y C5,15-methyltransferase (decarboxylating)